MKISNQMSNQNQKVNSYPNNLRNIEKQQQKNNERLSSGKKINKAGDDAAGLAIAEKMEALINGIGKGINNTYDMQNALKTADGSLSSINDSLNRVRELSLQASSGILNDDDKKLIQEEINQTLAGINDMAGNTQFNGQNLLDGSFTDKNVAMNPDGSGTTISIGQVSADALGLGNFSVLQDKIDLDAIDKAIDSVSTARVQIGAQINRFDYAIGSNSNAALNTVASKSKIEDADIAKETINRQTNKALSQYGMFAEKNRQQTQYNMLNILF
nr:flagellin [uncultured Tyzzerella sp.]